MSFYMLKLLSKTGLEWNTKDNGTFKRHTKASGSFDPEAFYVNVHVSDLLSRLIMDCRLMSPLWAKL